MTNKCSKLAVTFSISWSRIVWRQHRWKVQGVRKPTPAVGIVEKWPERVPCKARDGALDETSGRDWKPSQCAIQICACTPQTVQSIEPSDGTCMSLPTMEQPVVKKQDGPSWDVEMRRLAVPWDFVTPLFVLPHLCSYPAPRGGLPLMLLCGCRLWGRSKPYNF